MRLVDADYVTEKLNEINGTAELDKAFEVVENAPTVDVLEQIRDEIENFEINGHIRDVECFNAGIRHALTVIDKYKTESEEQTE